jgi:parallel beta-helix repeat protein
MKKTRLLVIEILLFFSIFSFFLSQTTSEDIASQTLYVGGPGAGNFTRIQDALENMTVGGTVYVFPGTYHETLKISKPVRLVGADTHSTVIDGDNESYVVTLAAGNSTLSGFTIIHSKHKFPFAGVYIVSNHNTISQNILTDNFYGMQLGYSANHNLVVNNTIHHNGRCGIYFNHASYNSLINNVVFDHPVNGFGLYEFSNHNSIIGNTFSDNRDTGVNIRECYDTTVTNNTFVHGHVALHKPAPEYHTTEHDNLFTDNVVSLEEERDAFVLTIVLFNVSIFFVFLSFRKLSK